MITMANTSPLTPGTGVDRSIPVCGPPSRLEVAIGCPAEIPAEVLAGSVIDGWFAREFAAIVAANWPVQDQPAPRRRGPRTRTIAPPRQPYNQGYLTGERRAGRAVSGSVNAQARQRSPPTTGTVGPGTV